MKISHNKLIISAMEKCRAQLKRYTAVFPALFLSVTFGVYANDSNAYSGSERTLTFAQAAELAVAASADLRHSRASQAVMEGAWKWGVMSYLPRLSISVSENDRLQQFGADTFMKNYGINIDQLIWDGGRTSMTRQLERMEIDMTTSRLERRESEIAEAAIAAYRNVLSSRAIRDIQISALEILEEQRRILSEEVRLGLALEIDLASADISLAEARINILSIQLDLDEMEMQFTELLGLDHLPVLAETVDVHSPVMLPVASAAAVIARERNPDIREARHSIAKKQLELNYVMRTWIPTFRINGNFGISGQDYPLTRSNWSVGLSIEFSNPWFSNRFSAQAGWEPPYDRTAMIQNSFSPLPDPASGYGVNQARLALALEQDNYSVLLERMGRMAVVAIEKCAFAEQKRTLSLQAAALGKERYRIEEIRLGLGQITRLKLMEIFIEQTQREIAVIQAATALLEAERELEMFLNLEPGELSKLALLFYSSYSPPH